MLAATSVLVVGTGCVNAQSKINQIGGTPLTSGKARVDVSGGTETGFDATLDRAQVGQVVTVFIYKNESDDLFSITGLGVTGTAKTSNNLALTVTTGGLAATSANGECTITIHHGGGEAVSGTATCTQLSSSQGNIDIKATFSASP